MKKIRISDLPLYSSLVGLFTLGTDKDNRSVKVSLEFIKDSTDAADTAAQAATTAKKAANTAATAANNAATNANTAKTAANTAATNANAAKVAATNAATAANTAAAAANTAKDKTEAAIAAAETATEEAQEATKAALLASKPTPLGMEVRSITRITFGNKAQNRIEATLRPETAMPNIIFISDNEAVRVSPQGLIKVVRIGISEVHIIPTGNTSLAQTILIRVEAPTLRLATTRNKIRLLGSGAIRLN